MSNNKQSSIDFLLDKLPNSEVTWLRKYVAQAKAMHKDEIMKSFKDGFKDAVNFACQEQCDYDSEEQYYTKTFGGQDNE